MRKSVVSNFIEKTWSILQLQEFQDTLRWQEGGRSFIILDQNSLATDILPRFFKHSNISSFLRQLNMYNFHKRKSLSGTLEFYHKLFRKDMRQLLVGIKRKPSEAEIIEGQKLIQKYQLQDEKLPDQNLPQNYFFRQLETHKMIKRQSILQQKMNILNTINEKDQQDEEFIKKYRDSPEYDLCCQSFHDSNRKKKIIILKNPPIDQDENQLTSMPLQ